MASPSRPIRANAAKGRATRAESAVTQQRILDAAEALFVEMGFAGTSLRAIASRAGVNLAAAHYHFGSKEGLLGATIHRRVAHANELRLGWLDELEARPEPASVEQILRVFFRPLSDEELRTTLPPLMARIYGEPESVSKPLLEREFGETAHRFVGALARALPQADVEEIRWRFHFVIGAMIQLLNFEAPLTAPAGSPSQHDGMSALLEFAIAGICQQGGHPSVAPQQRKGRK